MRVSAHLLNTKIHETFRGGVAGWVGGLVGGWVVTTETKNKLVLAVLPSGPGQLTHNASGADLE